MGLDWCLKAKVRPGNETLVKALNVARETGEITPLEEERLEKALISVAETLNAPRIGIDDVATEWLRDIYTRNNAKAIAGTGDGWYNKYWKQTFAEILEKENGKFVLGLVNYDKSTCLGIACREVDFRGKCIGYCDAISEELKAEAYEDHSAAQSVDYGTRLLASACNGVRKIKGMKGKTDEEILALYDAGEKNLKEFLSKVPKVGFFGGEEEKKAHKEWESLNDEVTIYLVDKAWAAIDGGRWCIFWGENGHGWHAWY